MILQKATESKQACPQYKGVNVQAHTQKKKISNWQCLEFDMACTIQPSLNNFMNEAYYFTSFDMYSDSLDRTSDKNMIFFFF